MIGRPRILIPLDKVEQLAKLQCTDEEIAHFFGVSLSCIEKRKREEAGFREALDRGKAEGRISLRRAQMKAAIEGNAAILVWLGKQMLKQRDTHHIEATLKRSIEDFTDEELAILAQQKQLAAPRDESGSDFESED
jgi:hypothetical protein